MKKYAMIAVVLVAVSLAALFVASGPSGPSLGGVHLLDSDGARLSDLTYDFLEDLRFKDFKKASTYHLPETQEKRDIPELIRRVFQVKHEILDIKSFKILGVDFDRSSKRARVRTLVFYRILGDERVRDSADNDRNLEMLFYWFEQPNGSWAMELESSLR